MAEQPSKHLTVITGDLVKSRHKSDRQQVSKSIQNIMTTLSKAYQSELAAHPAVRGIDEFWCALKRPARVYELCRELNSEIYPHTYRFVIVRDTVDVGIGSQDVTEMDGPAFHRAADLLRKIKQEKRMIYFSLKAEFMQSDQWMNELVQLIQILRQGWTSHQRQVIRLYESGKNQVRIARELDITQQGVSDALRQAHWHDVNRAEELLNGFLQGL